jgi:hypothetical protein
VGADASEAGVAALEKEKNFSSARNGLPVPCDTSSGSSLITGGIPSYKKLFQSFCSEMRRAFIASNF